MENDSTVNRSMKVPEYTRRAIDKYQEKNKEKLSQKYKNKYENDEEFRERKKRQSLERYYKKKELNKQSNHNI
jgi:hypothetical protein